MARAYVNGLAGAVASFPGAVFVPWEFRDEDRNGWAISGEVLNVPSSADGDGKRRLFLDYVPNEQSSITITVGGNARTLVEYGQTVGVGQVGLRITDGLLEFNAADSGLVGAASYEARGSVVNSALICRILAELVAVQTEVDAGAGGPSTPGTTVANNVPAFGDTGGASLVASRLTVRPAGVGDANTEVLLDGAVIGIWEPGSDRFRFSFGGSPVQHVFGLLKGTFEGEVNGGLASVARVIESAPATSGSIEFDLAQATAWSLETTGVSTISFVNAPAGECEVVLLITAGAGSPAVTWPGSVTWATGAEPDLLEGEPVRVVLRTINSGSTWTGYEDRPIATPASTTVGRMAVWDSITGKALDESTTIGDSETWTLQRFAMPPVADDSSATRVLAAADSGRTLYLTAASPAVQVPHTLPAGFVCTVVQMGTGKAVWSGTGGMTVRTVGGILTQQGQYSVATVMVKSATDCILVGQLG